jgi:predicted extracellular nuclease
MRRHIRNLAVAASACCVCGLLTVGTATAAGTAAPTATGGLTIHQVLGGGHVSLYAGQTVSDVPGVVTDVTSSAFYLQDPNPAGGPFKQAIEVYTGGKPTVVAGDDVTVTGEVTEYYPDESDTPSSLPIAELEDVTVTVVSTGNAPPRWRRARAGSTRPARRTTPGTR